MKPQKKSPDWRLVLTQIIKKRWPAGQRFFCLLLVKQLRRHVHAFHEQAQAPAAEPKGLSAGWTVPFAAQVPTQRGQGQVDLAHRG